MKASKSLAKKLKEEERKMLMIKRMIKMMNHGRHASEIMDKAMQTSANRKITFISLMETFEKSTSFIKAYLECSERDEEFNGIFSVWMKSYAPGVTMEGLKNAIAEKRLKRIPEGLRQAVETYLEEQIRELGIKSESIIETEWRRILDLVDSN